jgi:multisubunit Na+/H+ antiporter MnhB subunit
MVRTVNIEGVVDVLPEKGWVKSVPPLENHTIIGLTIVLGLFLLSVDWGAVLALIPFHLLGIDIWMLIAMGLILLLRFGMILIRPPIGGNVNSGFYASPQGKELYLWDTVGELILTGVFCLLVVIKSPIVFVIAGLMLFSRFKSNQEAIEGDVERWYPFNESC